MGAFLDKPKTEKQTEQGEGNGIKYGVSAMQGWRMEMEDAHVCSVANPLDRETSFFGVFDGHAGPGVAKYCSEHLLQTIIDQYKDLHSETDSCERIKKAIHKGFLELDNQIKSEPPFAEGKDRSGTTAVVAVITSDHIIFGNCGDSRGILSRDNKVYFHTDDHKPTVDKERLRIEKAGGSVMMQRVNGSLAVSRALGDFDYKRSETLDACEQLVSPEPDINILERKPDDEFLLLACDGIYDVMSNEEVSQEVHKQLSLLQSPTEICTFLIDKCLGKNSRDNMSVILVVFPGAPKYSEEKAKKEALAQQELEKEVDKRLDVLKDTACDALDLDGDSILAQLRTEFPDYKCLFINSDAVRSKIDSRRKEKFGQEDFGPNADESQQGSGPFSLIDPVDTSSDSPSTIDNTNLM